MCNALTTGMMVLILSFRKILFRLQDATFCSDCSFISGKKRVRYFVEIKL